MRAKTFYKTLLTSLKKRTDISITEYDLKYEKSKKVYIFLRIASKEIKSEDKVILISAGFHGAQEIAGPLTILRHANRIIDLIHGNGLKFILYPLINPSGFEAGLRYNIDDDMGSDDVGNNDFLRYELNDGKITFDIEESNNFKNWYWVLDERLRTRVSKEIRVPKETELMYRLLKKDPLVQIIACIDLHQDYISGFPPVAYYYAFKDLSRYQDIVKRIRKIIPVLCNTDVSAGELSPQKCDSQGFIVRHDGSLPDLMHRLGVEYCVTVETSVSTPLAIACQVNLIWISGIVDLIKDNFESSLELKIQENAGEKDSRFILSKLLEGWGVITFVRKQDGFKIYAVDGNWIRNNLSALFRHGGHGYVHEFIPRDEIWVETHHFLGCGCKNLKSENQEVSPEFFDSTVFHEITEFGLMKGGMRYKKAHKISLQEEIKKGMLKDPYTEVDFPY